MIIPSIDLASGRTVQLIGGRTQALDAGDPYPWLERFSLAGEVAVVDLDAALGRGNQRALIAELCRHRPCRVGGGIRSYEDARWWLNAGATRIVIGTAAETSLLARLPRDRVIAALDADDGKIVVEGWRRPTGVAIATRMRELDPFVSGFLVTLIELEGRLGGTDVKRAETLVKIAGNGRLTLAGGVTRPDEVATLDKLGVDAQVGMALYTERLSLADAILAPCSSDRADGLFPTVVVSERGEALGLAWSSGESVSRAIDSRMGVYHSRRRGIWVKGATSGNTQQLLAITPDCDRDALRFTVRQQGLGFCHTGTATCWGTRGGLDALETTIRARQADAPAGSYTSRLLSDPLLLRQKLVEEAGELADAASQDEAIAECADLVYFALVRLIQSGATLTDVDAELSRRALKVSRRGGDAKPSATVEAPLP